MADILKDMKQYYILSEVKLTAFKILKPGTVALLDTETAIPLVSAGLICPLLTAIKEGLYPPKKEESLLASTLKHVKETIKETQDEIASALPKAPAQQSPLVEKLKANTKDRNTHSVAFENSLRKKIQERKKNAKQSSS